MRSGENLPAAGVGEVENLVVVREEAGTVTDADDGAVESFEVLVEVGFVSRVEGAGGFVEEGVAGLGEVETGKSEALLFATGETTGPVFDRVETVGSQVSEIDLGEYLHQMFVCDCGDVGIEELLAQRAESEIRTLREEK
jgi:hypothetical protein